MTSLSFDFLPAASTSADRFVSFFNHQFLPVATLVFVGTIGAAIYFAFRYKRKREGEETPYLPHNYLIEFTSIFFVTVVVAIMWWRGWSDYYYDIQPKPNEYEINVIGQQWSWQIQYAHGKNLVNELYIPVNRPVHLIMTAKDVLHSFFVPAFRVKQDTVPGQFTSLRFTATKTGVFDLFCAEYCGTSHSGMIGHVTVLSQEDFQKWVDGTYKKPAADALAKEPAKLSMAEQGAALYRTRQCITCHTVDGNRLVGPSFKGIFGSERELVNGSKVVADENYVRESLMDPMKKVVKGYPPAMPTYRGMLSDEEVNQLVAYLKSLK